MGCEICRAWIIERLAGACQWRAGFLAGGVARLFHVEHWGRLFDGMDDITVDCQPMAADVVAHPIIRPACVVEPVE